MESETKTDRGKGIPCISIVMKEKARPPKKQPAPRPGDRNRLAQGWYVC